MVEIGAKIRDVMTTRVLTVDAGETMERVRFIFEHHKIHHVPVVKSGKVLGIISKADYYKILHGFTLFKAQKSEEYNNAVLRSLLAEEVMTKQVAKLQPEDSLTLAAAYFQENLFHAIPVVDDDDLLVGILTTYDLIAYAYKVGAFN